MDLSLCTSHSVSNSSTVCPTSTCHLSNSTSAIPSPISCSLNGKLAERRAEVVKKRDRWVEDVEGRQKMGRARGRHVGRRDVEGGGT